MTGFFLCIWIIKSSCAQMIWIDTSNWEVNVAFRGIYDNVLLMLSHL